MDSPVHIAQEVLGEAHKVRVAAKVGVADGVVRRGEVVAADALNVESETAVAVGRAVHAEHDLEMSVRVELSRVPDWQLHLRCPRPQPRRRGRGRGRRG